MCSMSRNDDDNDNVGVNGVDDDNDNESCEHDFNNASFDNGRDER
jgi:hypothetical protein